MSLKKGVNMPDISRRSVLSAALGAGLALAASALPAAAQFAAGPAPGRFSSVVVDITPLYAKGLDAYADVIRGALTTELQRAFADRIGGTGPRLVVRITGVSLNAYAGSSTVGGRGRSFGGGTDNDYLEGEALIVGPRGEVLGRHPQLSSTPASMGGAWDDPSSEQKRTAFLAYHYAAWLRRQI